MRDLDMGGGLRVGGLEMGIYEGVYRWDIWGGLELGIPSNGKI